MLEIEALEREAEKKEEKAKDGGEKGALEHRDLPSPLLQLPPPPPPQLGPSMALGESDDDDDDEDDGEDEEEEAGERERPVRLTNHTCEFKIDSSMTVADLKKIYCVSETSIACLSC